MRPRLRSIDTVHGPLGSFLSRMAVTSPDWPGASVVTFWALKGPALMPPGPEESWTLPPTSTVRPPVLRTCAVTVGWPALVRPALIDVISKFGAGGLPAPTKRYTRTPTRLITTTPVPGAGALRTSAQITAYRSPGAASLGTLKVTFTLVLVCGFMVRLPRSTAIQVVSSSPARSGAKAKEPLATAAPAGYAETTKVELVELATSTWRWLMVPGARWSTMYRRARGSLGSLAEALMSLIPMPGGGEAASALVTVADTAPRRSRVAVSKRRMSVVPSVCGLARRPSA